MSEERNVWIEKERKVDFDFGSWDEVGGVACLWFRCKG